MKIRWILIALGAIIILITVNQWLIGDKTDDVELEKTSEEIKQQNESDSEHEQSSSEHEQSSSGAEQSSSEHEQIIDEILKNEDPGLTKAREYMVEHDLKGRDIVNDKVLEVMGRVPRHKFIGKGLESKAYSDHPLPIDEGQTISQPYIVALMTQSLKLNSSDKVLEIGTGSGYQAAVLAELVDEVYTIEIRENLSKTANNTLKSLGYGNVKVKHSDGYFGWEENAPFDAIIVTCAANHIPPPLIEQLADGGRLIIPLGSTTYYQTLTLVEKKNDNLTTIYITGVKFVPMTGEATKE